MTDFSGIDPKNLFQDAYEIAGIAEAECRSIFLDWAISRPEELPADEAVELLHTHYGAKYPEHPMTRVLAEGLGQATRQGRRGGRRARLGDG